MRLYLLVAAAGLFGQGAHEATVDLRIGKKVFESQCALCHGQDGSGGAGAELAEAEAAEGGHRRGVAAGDL